MPSRCGSPGAMPWLSLTYNRRPILQQWALSNRFDPPSREIADRHYNRQKVGAPGFVPPGRCMVLRTISDDALWVTSWPYAEYTKHAWAGAWVCSAFRNEGSRLSSALITEAVAITRWRFGTPPDLGFITFVDRAKTRPKQHPGYCYRMAGWSVVGETKVNKLVALQLLPPAMPEPLEPIGAQGNLFV